MKNFITLIIVIILIVVTANIFQQKLKEGVPQKIQEAQINPAIGHRTKEGGCVAQGPLPDKACTPGAIFLNVTTEEICIKGYARSVRNVPVEIKHKVYKQYGITHHYKGEYEVDHLISLELGGSNDIANLWPEPAEPRPGFHEKDKVENYLHNQVCSGRIPLAEAQKKIANDWLEVFNSAWAN